MNRMSGLTAPLSTPSKMEILPISLRALVGRVLHLMASKFDVPGIFHPNQHETHIAVFRVTSTAAAPMSKSQHEFCGMGY